jgi:hypothetical protein
LAGAARTAAPRRRGRPRPGDDRGWRGDADDEPVARGQPADGVHRSFDEAHDRRSLDDRADDHHQAHDDRGPDDDASRDDGPRGADDLADGATDHHRPAACVDGRAAPDHHRAPADNDRHDAHHIHDANHADRGPDDGPVRALYFGTYDREHAERASRRVLGERWREALEV